MSPSSGPGFVLTRTKSPAKSIGILPNIIRSRLLTSGTILLKIVRSSGCGEIFPLLGGASGMAKRQRHRLTAREVQTTTKDICDGFGLWVQYTKQYDSRSWLFRYRFDGADDQMGLGSVLVTSLAEARKRADEARNLIARGVNPRVARDQAKRDRLEAAKNRMTFLAAFEAYISKHSVGWKSAKHLAQWKASLKHTRAINDLDAAAIDTPHLLRVLEPIWREKTETASRIRARIEMVLDFAKAAKARIRRQSRAMGSAQRPIAGAIEARPDRASCSAPVCRCPDLHGRASGQIRPLCPRARIHDSNRRARGRGPRRSLERDRPRPPSSG